MDKDTENNKKDKKFNIFDINDLDTLLSIGGLILSVVIVIGIIIYKLIVQ